MYYIIGLGNPDDKYQKTRHNVGWMAIEAYAEAAGAGGWSKDKPANALSTRTADAELFLPLTYMNRSGETAKYVVEKLGAQPTELVVVHDDIDLPFGEIKVAVGRGAGGNNGIQSIINSLGTKDFVRVRVGIAPKSFWTGKTKRPAGGGPLEKFVLKPFSSAETKQLPDIFSKTQQAIDIILRAGVDQAMNQVN
jgi:PTH1 family peptidyl-tRNA hydrolase